MPGRRSPQKPIELSQGTHRLGAFRGALDGSSSVPSPVFWNNESSAPTTECPELYFHQDKFAATGGMQSLSLTFVPVLNSEHVYLFPGGVYSGLYQEEKVTWERPVGKNKLQILNGMNTRSGDVVVVEYAYYAQDAIPPCGARYPLIVIPSPQVASDYAIAEGFPLTPSVAFPDSQSPYSGGDAWIAAGYSYGDEDVYEVGPGLAPGSSRSRRFTVLPGSYDTGEDIWMESDLHVSSGYSSPRWSTATSINYSTYYSITNAMAPFGRDEMGFNLYQYYPNLGTVNSWDSVPLNINLRWNVSEGWVLETDCHGDYQERLFPLGSWAGVTPFDPGTHYIEVKLDIPNSIISARFDNLTFSQKVPDIWYPDEMFSFEAMGERYYDYGYDDITIEFWLWQHVANGSVPTEFCVDKATLSTDVSYCQWGLLAPPGAVGPAGTWTTPGQVWWRMDQRLPINEGTAGAAGNAYQYTNYAYPVVTTPIAPGSTAALRANGSNTNWCFLKGNISAPPVGAKTFAAEFWSQGPGELWLYATMISLYLNYGSPPYNNAIAWMDSESSRQLRPQLPLPPGTVHHIKVRAQVTPTWPPYPHPFEENATYMLTLSLDVNGTAISQTGPVANIGGPMDQSTTNLCSFLFRNSTIVVDEFRYGWE